MKQSRKCDELAGVGSFGNPVISELVKGRNRCWISFMSQACWADVLASHADDDKYERLRSLTVDEVMGRAILSMTEKLLVMYSFTQFVAGTHPEPSHYMAYVQGS